MAEQCIVCLEILDSAEPLQGGDHGGLPADLSEPPLALAAASPPTATTSTNSTTENAVIQDSPENDPDSNNYIAVIQVCKHVLHDSCLREWTVKANSCPFCRQAFHLVEVYDKIGGESLCPSPPSSIPTLGIQITDQKELEQEPS